MDAEPVWRAENMEAIEFLKKFNHLTHTEHPGVVTIAEESTAWPLVTRPPEAGRAGLFASNGTWAGCTTRWAISGATRSTANITSTTDVRDAVPSQREFCAAAVA